MNARITVSKEFCKAYKKHADRIERADRIKQFNFVRIAERKYLGNRAHRLLDIGCGEGQLDRLLKSRYQVMGIDKSRTAISRARKRVKGVKFVLKDIKDLPTKEKYDVVVSTDAIDHDYKLRKDFKKVLAKLAGCLTRDGILIFELNFLMEVWKKTAKTRFLLRDGSATYEKLFYRSVRGNDGISHSVMSLTQSSKVIPETSPEFTSKSLLKLDNVIKYSNESGFEISLYDGWGGREIREAGKNPIVCVLFKRRLRTPNP